MSVKVNEITVNLSDLSALTGLNLMNLKKKLEDIPAIGPGPKGSILYNLKAALQAIYVHSDNSLPALRLKREKAETRLAEAKAIKVEFENALKEKAVIPMAEAESAYANLIHAFKARLLAIPSKAAFEILQFREPSKTEAYLNSLIREALDELTREVQWKPTESRETST